MKYKTGLVTFHLHSRYSIVSLISAPTSSMFSGESWAESAVGAPSQAGESEAASWSATTDQLTRNRIRPLGKKRKDNVVLTCQKIECFVEICMTLLGTPIGFMGCLTFVKSLQSRAFGTTVFPCNNLQILVAYFKQSRNQTHKILLTSDVVNRLVEICSNLLEVLGCIGCCCFIASRWMRSSFLICYNWSKKSTKNNWYENERMT